MFENNGRKALDKYLNKLSLQSASLSGKTREIFNALLSFCDTPGIEHLAYRKQRIKNYNTLWAGNDKIAGIFSGSEYRALETLLGREWAERFKKIWDRSTGYIYLTGPARRSFRTKTYEVLYLPALVEKVKAMVYLAANDFSYATYLSRPDNAFYYSGVIADLLALEIDEGNEAVLSRLHDIVYGDNNTGLITREIIKGLLMSHSSQAHQWAGDLLLAARLQEGLRQVIVECMDEGSKEGFLYMLKIILEHDLARFSSVVRAVDVWAGLGIAAQKPAVVKKCLENIYRCLTQGDYAGECLESSDALLIFIGLWAAAFDDIAMTENKLRKLLSADEKYKRLAALGFLSETQFPLYQHRLAMPLLAETDYEVLCFVIENLFADLNLFALSPEYSDNIHRYRTIEGICSAVALFYKLKDVLDKMPKKELIYTGSLFPWQGAYMSCNDIIVKMLLSMAGDASGSMVDLMLDYRNKMNIDTRTQFVSVFLRNPKTKKQKTAIVEFMGDKSPYVRNIASKIVKELVLSPDDYIIIEDLLQYKSGDLRKNAISILLRQPPEALLESVRRLLNDKNENKQLAALDMIAKVDSDPKYKTIAPACRQAAVLLSDISQKTRLLAEKITNTNVPVYTAADGFGLYNPKKDLDLPQIPCPKGFSAKDILSSSIEDIKKTLFALNELIDKHKDFEYEMEDWNGACRVVMLGAEIRFQRMKGRGKRGPFITLDDYPLPEVWLGAAKEHNLTVKKLLAILFYNNFSGFNPETNQEWYAPLMYSLFPIKLKIEFNKTIKQLPYANHIHTILQGLFNECPKSEVFPLCRDMSCYIYENTPVKSFAKDYDKKIEEIFNYTGSHSVLANANDIAYWYRNMREL